MQNNFHVPEVGHISVLNEVIRVYAHVPHSLTSSVCIVFFSENPICMQTCVHTRTQLRHTLGLLCAVAAAIATSLTPSPACNYKSCVHEKVNVQTRAPL